MINYIDYIGAYLRHYGLGFALSMRGVCSQQSPINDNGIHSILHGLQTKPKPLGTIVGS
jgi:hypothetical protein